MQSHTFDKPPNTYGLATQLRTPPLDDHGGFPSNGSINSYSSSPKKVTPAMRDELQYSPRAPAPVWGSKDSPPVPSSRTMKDQRSRDGARRKESKSVYQPSSSSREYEQPSGPVPPRKPHSRTKSSPSAGHHTRFPSQSGIPTRPNRPSSPIMTPSYAPVPPLPANARHFTPVSAQPVRKIDYNAAPPVNHLDLGVKLDTTNSLYSTYNSNSHAAKSTPNLRADEDEGLYEANVSVGVAQRVQRSASFRKASLGVISRSGSLDSQTGGAGGVPAPPSHLRPPRQPSLDGGVVRPIGQGLRSSYAGSVAPAAVFRRSSSVYIPNPSSAPPPTITPAARLPLNLLTLARRTAHISSVPGYGWRLHLLEKLETIMGSFLTVQDAEAILSIGNGPEKTSRRSESRKSQIGMPPPSTSARQRAPAKPSKPVQKEKTGFLGMMKRALSAPHHEGLYAHSPAPPPLPRAKAVFGVPLGIVAEYGFVTSMIAGQRHDLPGICFSTVEEIYRRGQGMNVPGLLHLAGEPTRVAKLVNIFDTAPDYGEHHDLSIESVHTVTSLLKKYLRDLPEPILDERLWRLYLAACVDSTNPLKSRIACAQIILRLLPTPNFSLLVYLVAFLSQMPLFPENRLTLESVSTIFGAAAMSPRGGASSNKFPKFLASSGMHITGPTESFESGGVNVKKSQDALLWLLTHWSSVADGLLEPDFDIDVADVLGQASPLPSFEMVSPTPPSRPQLPDSQSTHTLEILSVPRFNSVSTSSPPASPREARAPPLAMPPPIPVPSSPSSTIRSSSSPIMPSKFGNMSPFIAAAFDDHHSSDSVTPVADISDDYGPATPAKEVANPLANAFVGSAPSDKTASTDDALSTPEITASSRSSDSSIESAHIGTPSYPKEEQAPVSEDLELKSRQGEPFKQATPEDEFGPLGPPGTSVLDDLLEFDDISRYSFPTPPSTIHSKSSDAVHNTTMPSPSIFSQRSPRPDSVILVRSKDEQLKEAQQLCESQRREVQSLWKQLTDLELERTADRAELGDLKNEVTRLRAAGNREEADEEHHIALSAMETKFLAAQKEATSAREEVRSLVEQLRQHDEDAQERINSLSSQLDGIRSLLLGGAR